MRNLAAANHCANAGHNIQSIVFGYALDPSSKVVIPVDVRVFCVSCGLTLEEIREWKNQRTPRKKKDTPQDFSTLDEKEK